MNVLFLNCTLKQDGKSNTQALIDKASKEFKSLGVTTRTLRVSRFMLPPSTEFDVGDGDEWSEIYTCIEEADIVIIASSVWVGQYSSLVQRVFERLDSLFHNEDLQDEETGQYDVYNKVAGVLVTGNEDGAKNACYTILGIMSGFGFSIPPNAMAYWVGEAGPGPSYIKAGGKKHLFTNKTYRILVHNTVALARSLQKTPIDTNLNTLTKEAEKESI